MKKYSKGIDGYMHELCSAKLIDNPKDFRKQVFKTEKAFSHGKEYSIKFDLPKLTCVYLKKIN